MVWRHASHSSRRSVIGSSDSARCAGIHVASNPSNTIATDNTPQYERIARSCLIDDGSQHPGREDSEDQSCRRSQCQQSQSSSQPCLQDFFPLRAEGHPDSQFAQPLADGVCSHSKDAGDRQNRAHQSHDAERHRRHARNEQRAFEILFPRLTMNEGSAVSSSRNLTLMSVASCCGSVRSESPAMSQWRAIAGSGKTLRACGSSVRLVYFPSSTIPTTCMRAPSRTLKYRPIASLTEPKILRANSLVDDGDSRRISIVVPGDRPAREQRSSSRVEVFGRDAEQEWLGRRRSRPQVRRFVGIDRGVRPGLIQRRRTHQSHGR